MYPADQALVFGEMGFAVLAAVDLVAGEVVVVYQTHGCGLVRSVEHLVFGVFLCGVERCCWIEAPAPGRAF